MVTRKSVRPGAPDMSLQWRRGTVLAIVPGASRKHRNLVIPTHRAILPTSIVGRGQTHSRVGRLHEKNP